MTSTAMPIYQIEFYDVLPDMIAQCLFSQDISAPQNCTRPIIFGKSFRVNFTPSPCKISINVPLNMLLFLAALCLSEAQTTREVHPLLIKEARKMDFVESVLDETVTLLESKIEDFPQEKMKEYIQRLKTLNEEADKIINSYPKVPSSKTTAIPLKLITSSIEAKKERIEQKVPGGTFPEASDFKGFVAYGENAKFVFEPVIALRNKTIGCYFQPLQNVTCEVKELELAFFRDAECVYQHKVELAQNGDLAIFDFDKPVEFQKLEVRVLKNYGDKKRICLGDFDLFNRKE